MILTRKRAIAILKEAGIAFRKKPHNDAVDNGSGLCWYFHCAHALSKPQMKRILRGHYAHLLYTFCNRQPQDEAYLGTLYYERADWCKGRIIELENKINW